MTGTELIADLREQGFTDNEIMDALCDGEYLGTLEISQEEVEEAYEIVMEVK